MRAWIAILCSVTCVRAARADVVVYDEDRDGWFGDAGEVETIGFTGFRWGTRIDEQYAAFGVHFVDGSDFSWCCSFATFPQDGAGLSGNELIDIVFDEPISAIAVDLPGDVKFELMADGTAFFASPGLGGSGPGHFGGLVSTQAFDRVRIWDWADDDVYIDDLHFGPSIPGPSAMSAGRFSSAMPSYPNTPSCANSLQALRLGALRSGAFRPRGRASGT